jgi:nitrate reductase NapE
MADDLCFQRSDLYMTDPSNKIEPVPDRARGLRDELLVFLIIVALVWPIITVGVVGGYGFAVWMYQIVAGPPGPPRR